MAVGIPEPDGPVDARRRQELPSGEKASAVTFPSCPSNTACSLPLDTSQTHAVFTPVMAASREPSRLKANGCEAPVRRQVQGEFHPGGERDPPRRIGPRTCPRCPGWTGPAGRRDIVPRGRASGDPPGGFPRPARRPARGRSARSSAWIASSRGSATKSRFPSALKTSRAPVCGTAAGRNPPRGPARRNRGSRQAGAVAAHRHRSPGECVQFPAGVGRQDGDATGFGQAGQAAAVGEEPEVAERDSWPGRRSLRAAGRWPRPRP